MKRLIPILLAGIVLACTSVTFTERPDEVRITVRTLGTGTAVFTRDAIQAQSSGANVLSFFNHAVDAARLYFTRGLALPGGSGKLPATPAEPAGDSEEIQP